MSGDKPPFPPVPPVGHVLTQRAIDKRYVGVFVEGPDDVQLWSRWLKHRPVGRGGCREVRAALDELRRSKVPGCVGIVDADLERLRGRWPDDLDLIVSGAHDHECDLVLSPAFDRLLQSLPTVDSDLQKLAHPSSLRDALRDRALPFGLVRWLYLEQRQKFPDRLTPNNEELLDRRTWTLHRNKLIELAAEPLGRSMDQVESQLAELLARVAAVAQLWEVCHGHDVVELLRLAFYAVKRPRSERDIRHGLQLALDSADLQSFPMWRQLEAWETRNGPYSVRKC